MRTIVITARKRSLGQGNTFIGVCQEFCSWGGVPGQVPLQVPPWDQVHPPGTRYTPRTRSTPPRTRYTPRDQVHPQRRACWQIRSMRGRYASYWNAILSKIIRSFSDLPPELEKIRILEAPVYIH